MNDRKEKLKHWRKLIEKLEGVANLADMEVIVIKPITPKMRKGTKTYDMRAIVTGKSAGLKGDFLGVFCHQDDCNWEPCSPELK